MQPRGFDLLTGMTLPSFRLLLHYFCFLFSVFMDTTGVSLRINYIQWMFLLIFQMVLLSFVACLNRCFLLEQSCP